jgi:hypothetical protein
MQRPKLDYNGMLGEVFRLRHFYKIIFGSDEFNAKSEDFA